jgi:tetratricopeptide (TPR) repeat protein
LRFLYRVSHLIAYIEKVRGWSMLAVLVLGALVASAADYLDAARARLEAGQLPEAQAALREVLRSHPGSLDAHLMLAFVESKLGHAEPALREYRAAIRIDPESFAAHYNLALFYLSQNQPDSAVPELQRAARLQPGNAGVMFNLGVVMNDLGRANEALPALLSAAKGRPGRPEIEFQLARAYGLLHMDKPGDQAGAAFLQLASADPRARDALVEAWIQTGRYEAALGLLDAETTSAARFLRARALYHLGRAGEAAKEAELALSSEPSNGAVLLFLARLEQRAGDWDAATALLDRAATAAPNWFEPRYSRAAGFYARQRYDEALSELDAALKLNPDCARCLFLTGVTLFNQGRLKEAEAPLRQAARIEPSNARFRTHLAELFLRTSRAPLAETTLRKAIELAPNYALAHYELGKVLLAQNRLEPAATEFDSAAKLEPALAQALYRLGQTYAKLGRKADADRAFAEFRRRKASEKDETLQMDIRSGLDAPN